MAGQNGGKRPGAGRKKGSKNKVTLEKQAVLAAFNQRVLTQADELFNAQLTLAVGSVQVFRVEETLDSRGNVKREHILVTHPDEIKSVLDETDGLGAGTVGEHYYFVTELSPDNRAIESMLNRAVGKPKESVEVKDVTASALETAKEFVQQMLTQKDADGNPFPREQIIAAAVKEYGVLEEDIIG